MVRVTKSGEFDNRSPEGRKRNKRRGLAVAITTIGLTIAIGCLCEWDGKILIGGFLIALIVSGLIWKMIFSVFNIFH